ncbi:MAG: hypothetical protein A2927_03105 [Candidatus Komeilibacteria bacterium RIFCSPLOWO2_01_FULL_45_10]|uniref:Dockerin domain-containing protein n=1 Tax=Candidatus Komeilibacteria bacterium RIFCSPLOWO2_01_FULL_45_10 TaxID=1798550 RepID=A0A1G2BJT1_9BACT|nr:MAG: hypothetical protein A2927_03105 [Candidatus Komeilibacteria bacterium RIFCSPLOWO2_01_FULL_45_10]
MLIHPKDPQFLFFGVLMVIILGSFFIFSGFSRAQTDSITATVQVSVCGDGEMGGTEECDDDDFNGETCSSQGFTSGSLDCTDACELDTSGCRSGGTPGGGSPGGGCGGYIAPTVTGINLSGKAYPKSSVTILKDAQVAATTAADSNANFQVSLSGLSAGTYIFSVYSEDNKGRRSNLLTFPVSITTGTVTTIAGIFIPPTIDVDKSEVKRGDDIVILGQSVPQADMVISVNSEEEFFAKTISDKSGLYLYNFDTVALELGNHNTKSKASIGNQSVSSWSYLVNFRVGSKNVLKTQLGVLKGDLNGDGKVNLVDFSIAAYWYKQYLSDAFKVMEKERLNTDGKVDLVDFSIMAYYWTG